MKLGVGFITIYYTHNFFIIIMKNKTQYHDNN